MRLSNYSFFFAKKRALPILFCHKSEPSKQYMSFRIIWKKFATIATLGTNQDPTLPPAMLSTVGYLHATGEISKDNHAWRVGDVDIFFAFQGPFFLTKEEDLELLHRHNLLKSPGAVLVADNVLSTAAVGLLWRTGRGILHMRVIWIEGV